MPVVLGIIALVLAVGAIYIVAIAAMLLILPAIAAGIGFHATINYWIDEKLRADNDFRRSISLTASNNGISWHMSMRNSALWPTLPLAAASGAALLGLLFEVPMFKPKLSSNDAFFWQAATFVAFCGAGGGPFLAALGLKDQLGKFLTNQVLERVSARFQGETALLGNIIGAEQNMISLYQSVGVRNNATAIDSCREVVLQQATGDRKDARRELSGYLEGLNADLAELQRCVELFDQVRVAFERAKASVIRNGSGTLLGELDRIQLGLRSDLLMQLFEARKWSELREVFELIISELNMVRSAAERGEAQLAHEVRHVDGQIPRSLDDAYQVLNVNADTRKEVIKKLVDALRMSWHPDLASGDEDRKGRHVKIQQINVAWDIIKDNHVRA